MSPDPFDPNTWEAPEPFRRVYLDKHAEVFAMVDHVDYEWAIQWLWRITFNSTGRLMYATRTMRVRGCCVTVYLHKEILKRSRKRRPTRFHIIGDHRNGRSLDCRRRNLRWATPRMNSLNRFGIAALQTEMVAL